MDSLTVFLSLVFISLLCKRVRIRTQRSDFFGFKGSVIFWKYFTVVVFLRSWDKCFSVNVFNDCPFFTSFSFPPPSVTVVQSLVNLRPSVTSFRNFIVCLLRKVGSFNSEVILSCQFLKRLYVPEFFIC